MSSWPVKLLFGTPKQVYLGSPADVANACSYVSLHRKRTSQTPLVVKGRILIHAPQQNHTLSRSCKRDRQFAVVVIDEHQ
jgi:hypothetical protein